MEEARLRRRASVVCVREERLLVVRAEDPAEGREYLLLPGGAIEPGEEPPAAAERETLEETGYRVRVDAGSERVVRYPFRWGGVLYDCMTCFYRAELIDSTVYSGEMVYDPILKGVEWIEVEQVDAAFAYHDAIRVAVKALLQVR